MTMCTFAAFAAASMGHAVVWEPAAPPAQQLASPHETLGQLDFEVIRLREQGILNQGQSESLTAKLDNAGEALAVGDPAAVIRPLNALDAEVRGLVTAQVISFKDALFLQDLTAQAIIGINAISTPPFVLPGLQPCPLPDACDKLVLHVDATAAAGGDGSEAEPYRSMDEAIAAADAANACGIEIVLHGGSYSESLVVTRPTSVHGEDRPVIVGSLYNPNGYELVVSGVLFNGSPAPGAIVVDGPCGSHTEVSDVVIRGAREHGIFQRRGSLRVLGTAIRGTIPDPGDADTGRAIRALDGAQAVVGFANLSFNAGGALLADGEDTRVYLALSSVEGNELHPLLAATPSTSGTGVVEADDGATLLVEFTNIVGNTGTGLLVGNAARGHFRYGRLDHSRDVTIDRRNFYGINALALYGGTLELTHFRSEHADFIGLYVLGGYGRASHGWISYNTIGVAARGLPADFSVDELFACFDDVRLLHNERQFDGDFFPLPCDEETPGACPACTVAVPFVCTWCGS